VTRLDQFASVFRSAAKDRFRRRDIAVRDVLVASDLDDETAAAYATRVAAFLADTPGADARTIRHSPRARTEDLGALIEQVADADPDLVVTYRNLHSEAWRWPYTLGDHVEVLTQVTEVPILLLPRFDAGEAPPGGFVPPRTVMAMTDHLAGDDQIVNWAVAMAGRGPGRRVVLAHVEDDLVFERYMSIVGKTPDIETGTARREIRRILLQEPTDWIATVAAALDDVPVEVVPDVSFGHQLATYKRLVEAHDVDLLVLHTKDEDQLAMHGAAYPVAVELRRTPMLLL